MNKVIKSEYFSKSEAFLLPLTHLSKSQKYPMNSYLFWNEYSIEDFKLILKFKYDDYTEFIEYCKKVVFPVLDKNGYLSESFDLQENESIFILDLSEWAFDIRMFLNGKYSKMSNEAKKRIKSYHTYFKDGLKLDLYLRACIEPNVKMGLLGDMTPIEYVCRPDTFGLNREDVDKIGELGNIYNEKLETLVTDPAKMAGNQEGNAICTI